MKRWMTAVTGLAALLGGGLAGAAGTTLDNLQAAYSAESNGMAHYEAFAAKADAEGYKSVALLFRATADSVGIHARNLAGIIKKMKAEPKATPQPFVVKSTRENLEASLKGDLSVEGSIYPAYMKQAEAEKKFEAAMAFEGNLKTETEHVKFFQAALGDLDGWKSGGKEIAVCQVCGYTVMGSVPARCAVCGSPREKFKKMK